MRNDFYIGMYEDNYLAHSDTNRYHKYIQKVWRNGKWYYIYKVKPTAKKVAPYIKKGGQLIYKYMIKPKIRPVTNLVENEEAQQYYKKYVSKRR